MEIFIIGGFIVALMIVVSTKIKKSAAEAYEAEIIETADFKIYKPDGFISSAERRFSVRGEFQRMGQKRGEQISAGAGGSARDF